MRNDALPALVLSACLVPELACADVPVTDVATFQEQQKRDGRASSIEEADRARSVIHRSVGCAMFRKGGTGDPVSAAEANPEIAGLARRIAREEGVDENEFLALIYQESRFNPCARSPAGAIGLTQLMPATAAELGVNPYEIEDNLRGGARYYKQQLDRYHGSVPLALAAYNSGAGNVNKYGGIPPFRETQAYVTNITSKWLPAFGGSDKSAIPLNYGGGDTAYIAMRNSTLNAMAVTSATSDSLSTVEAWYKQRGAVQTATIQDSWDHNASVRSANLETINIAIGLATAMAGLIDARNSVALSDLSSTARSIVPSHRQAKAGDLTGLCDGREGLAWSDAERACVRIHQPDTPQEPLLLQAQ